MNDDFDIEVWLEILDGSLERLAADASTQAAYLEAKGVFPIVDELGLEFDTGWRPLQPVLKELPGAQALLAALRRVDAELESEQLDWDAEALRSSATWSHVRENADRARRALVEWRAHHTVRTSSGT